MAKKDKPFQNGNFALSNIWGTTVIAQNQGGRIHTSAQRAGVKIDTPLTPPERAAQKLANGLIAKEKAAEKALDPRGSYEKKYDIRDDVAHITMDVFRGLVVDVQKLRRLGEKVKSIHIEDGYGSSAELIPYAQRLQFNHCEDQNPTEIVSSETFLRLGLAATLKGNPMITICSNKTNLGILKCLSIPSNLAFHTELTKSTEIDKELNEVILHPGNLREKLLITSSLEEELRRAFSDGIALTVNSYQKRKDGPLKVGTLWHPDRISTSDIHLEEISYSSMRGKDRTYFPERDRNAFLSDFFNNKSGYIITLNKKPFAILLRENHPEP